MAKRKSGRHSKEGLKQPAGSQEELTQAKREQATGSEAETEQADRAEVARKQGQGKSRQHRGKQVKQRSPIPAERDQRGQPEQPDESAQPVLPIVGIGASAGGLEALQTFFSNLPPDNGMAFVVITHVRPGRESLMPELLRNVTSMTVVASEDETAVRPNTVIVAKDSMLDIANGRLRAVKIDSEKEVTYHPIDHFFRALAQDQQEHAIGVVLSGSGNDGTLGVKAIKAAGGMAMVQDPDTAKYASMPQSAVATQLADYVLPPDRMPQALVEHSRGPYLKLSRRKERQGLPEDAVSAVLVRLRAQTGQDFTCYKKSTMSRRIERRMNVHHIDNPQDYVRFLRENPRELQLLQQELLISVTSFFRDPEAFEALAQKGIGWLLNERPEGSGLRVWVPGCASGEEAYSVAVLLREQMQRLERMHDVQMFATDLDERAIEIARAGIYPEGIAADVSADRLKQFFSREDGAYRINKNVREMIVFAIQNVISDPPFTRMDLIVCRNVLIYLDAAAQQQVLAALHYALRPGGLLFLGGSESLGESEHLFEAIDSKHKILRRRELPIGARPGLNLPLRPPRSGEKTPPAEPAVPQIGRTIERMLLDEFTPCTVVIDERGTVVYAHGRAGQFFQPEQGQPRNDLLAMAREGLASALATAIRQARRQQREVVRRAVRVRTNGDHVDADLTVRPLTGQAATRGMLLIILAPTQRAARQDGKNEQPDHAETSDRELVERELQHTRETLQTTIEELETSNEELKSSNEELQSTNEELQSTNEELETSKEEMQSLNEELNTVNSELQSKVSALARANDDMNNLLNSMQVATIFLDTDMRVKRYTEQAKDVVRLIGSDIGRPLTDLTSSLNYPGLIEDCRRVLATLIPREKEAQDGSGRWYMVRLMPYRTADNVIDGVVMTMVDIDRTKRAESGRADFFKSIVQTVRHPLLLLDGDLRVVMANPAFDAAFKTRAEEWRGRRVYELGNGQWDIPELRQLLEEILPRKKEFEDFKVEHDFPLVGRRSFLLNARRLERLFGAQPELILLAFEDVTGRK